MLTNVKFKTSAFTWSRQFSRGCSGSVPMITTSESTALKKNNCFNHKVKMDPLVLLGSLYCQLEQSNSSLIKFKPTWTVWTLICCRVPNQLTWKCTSNCQFYSTFLLESKEKRTPLPPMYHFSCQITINICLDLKFSRYHGLHRACTNAAIVAKVILTYSGSYRAKIVFSIMNRFWQVLLLDANIM